MMSRSLAPLTAALLCAGLSACAPRVAPERPRAAVVAMQKVAPQNLCVTEGRVHDRGQGTMEVDSPAMRAVVTNSSPEVAELRFVYEGPTDRTEPLADGEIRRQAGLKLRAADTCNVVYVIWRFEPEPKLVVSVKNNPGKHRHAECGDGGYQNVKPAVSRPVPRPKPGDEHLLQAMLTGSDLQVHVDRELAWQGRVDVDAAADGPVGIRSDNARLAFELAAIPGDRTADSGCGGVD